jgi:hypothetical protein
VTHRERIAALVGAGGHIIDVEDRANCLVLEPLPRVTGMDTGALGELGSGRRPTVGKLAVQPEPITEINGLQIECFRGQPP